jgi:hypothetical protein
MTKVENKTKQKTKGKNKQTTLLEKYNITINDDVGGKPPSN